MDTFIARQPIFEDDQKVFAYALLSRSGLEEGPQPSDPDRSSSKVIADSVLSQGFDTLTGGKKGVYPLSRETLVKGYYDILPEYRTVLEISEQVEPDAEVVKACERLKQSGYLLALDDFVYHDRYKALVELADIVKVDFLSSNPEGRRRLADRFGAKGIQMLAHKVESWDDYLEAKEIGYSYFQGYYFSTPMIVTGQEIPGYKLHYLQVLQEIQQPHLDYRELERIIKLEMSLAYKLLRYINSAFFGWRAEIASMIGATPETVTQAEGSTACR